MKTLNISISDTEYYQLGLETDSFSFSELVDMVSRKLARQTLDNSVLLAEKYGIANMSMDEITAEVKAVRRNAKGDN